MKHSEVNYLDRLMQTKVNYLDRLMQQRQLDQELRTKTGRQQRALRIRVLAREPLSKLEKRLLRLLNEEVTWEQFQNRLQRMAMLAVLKDCNGNQCEAARRLNVHRNTISRLMEEF